jgi:hypothetical protein
LVRVADVVLDVPIVRQILDQPLNHPRRRRLGAEEASAHVVVDADDVPAEVMEVAGRLRPDEAT